MRILNFYTGEEKGRRGTIQITNDLNPTAWLSSKSEYIVDIKVLTDSLLMSPSSTLSR